VRAAAASALGQMGSDAALVVPNLIEALKDLDPGVRAAAASALGQMGSDAALVIPNLIEALKDLDPGVRTATVSALGYILLHLDKKTSNNLVEAINHSVKALSVNESNRIIQDKVDLILNYINLERINNDVQVDFIDDRFMYFTLALNDSNSDVRAAAAWALGYMASYPVNYTATLPIPNDLSEALKDPNPVVRSEAALALSYFPLGSPNDDLHISSSNVVGPSRKPSLCKNETLRRLFSFKCR